MRAIALWALMCQKLLVIMMMTTPGEPFERMSQGGTGCAYGTFKTY